ncbi:MAG: iron-sulfur cluster assembly accessory protein [Chthonomonas sp.]|nr:iron-sulfur cluster assembly accessory protein [Chthonomonas sp.]
MTTDFPVSIEDSALVQLRRMLDRKGDPEAFIRIGVKGGGCSGFEYVIKVDNKPSKFDIRVELDGVPVVSDSRSAKYLQGAVVKSTKNLLNNALTIENPNASRSCGCGTSFTPKDDLLA